MSVVLQSSVTENIIKKETLILQTDLVIILRKITLQLQVLSIAVCKPKDYLKQIYNDLMCSTAQPSISTGKLKRKTNNIISVLCDWIVDLWNMIQTMHCMKFEQCCISNNI